MIHNENQVYESMIQIPETTAVVFPSFKNKKN